MKKLLLLVLLIFAAGTSTCLAQKDVQVSDPEISQDGRQITITYDILNASREDLFDVNILITAEDGKALPSGSLKGDVGTGVRGGNSRVATWNPEDDGVDLGIYVFVEVLVQKVSPSEPGVNRVSLMMQSLVFPGLGLTRYTAKPHWIKGVAGYGCLAGSVILNRMGVQVLEDIDSEPSFDQKLALYDRAISLDQTSEILAYTALGIWVADLAWTFLATSGEGKSKGLRVGTGFDRKSGAGLLCLTYTF